MVHYRHDKRQVPSAPSPEISGKWASLPRTNAVSVLIVFFLSSAAQLCVQGRCTDSWIADTQPPVRQNPRASFPSFA